MPDAFIHFEVLIDDTIIQDYREIMDHYPADAPHAFKRTLIQNLTPAIELLKQEPGPPHYPIRWKSERQRRAFFATEGFGRGIPASRSQPPAVLEGWTLFYESNGYDFEGGIGNDVPWVVYVQGDFAQPFHLDTGYVQMAPVFVEYGARTYNALIETWFNLWESKHTK